MLIRIFLSMLGFIALTCGLVACTRAPITVYLDANSKLNPDVLHQPLPVQVKIFQLQNADAFLRASFFELWKQDRATLGDSFLDKRVLIVDPRTTVKQVLRHNKECRYLGVMAVFRKPQGRNWKLLRKVPPIYGVLPMRVRVFLTNNRIELQ